MGAFANTLSNFLFFFPVLDRGYIWGSAETPRPLKKEAAAILLLLSFPLCVFARNNQLLLLNLEEKILSLVSLVQQSQGEGKKTQTATPSGTGLYNQHSFLWGWRTVWESNLPWYLVFLLPLNWPSYFKAWSNDASPNAEVAQVSRDFTPAFGEVWERKLYISHPLQQASTGIHCSDSVVGRLECSSHLHTFCLILNAGWWSSGSLGTNQTHSGLISFNLFPESGKLNCCLSCKSLLHKGPIILLFLGLLAHFSSLPHACPSPKLILLQLFLFLHILSQEKGFVLNSLGD